MITITNVSDDSGDLVFSAKSGEEELGRLNACIKEDTLVITDISSEMFLIDGLCRTAMNYAYNRLINACRFDIKDESVLAELVRLGFVKIDDNFISDIDNFFNSHKSCKK